MLACQTKNKDLHTLSLFLTEGDLKRLEESKVKNHFHHKHYVQLKSIIDSTMQLKVEVPDRGGNWPHHYVDPEEGDRLITGKQIGPLQWEHYDSDCTKVYLGNPGIPAQDYDGVVIQQKIHHGYANYLFGASLLYRLDRNSR